MQNSPIVLIQPKNVINVKSAFPISPNFVNFSLPVATEGQTVFTLPSYPILTGLFSLNIDGVAQDPLNGDYTVNGNILTITNNTLITTDRLAGFYQVMSSAVNPSILSYRSFYFQATQGQNQFNIGFVPKAIIYIAVNGIIQSAGNGDYIIDGAIITLSQGLNAGDNFFGLAIQ
jgi:hypothetical protein